MRDALYQDAAGACPRRGPVCFEDKAQSCFAVTALRPRLRARRARAVSKDSESGVRPASELGRLCNWTRRLTLKEDQARREDACLEQDVTPSSAQYALVPFSFFKCTQFCWSFERRPVPSGVSSSPAPPFLRPQTTWELVTVLIATRRRGADRRCFGQGGSPRDAGAGWTQT